LGGRPGIIALHRRSDGFLGATRLESFGIATLEARCIGLPVIGLASSGLTEFVTDGLDDGGLAADREWLAADREWLAGMTRHNREVAPDFDWPDIVERVNPHYVRALRLH
jgi:glycosyltransferase involved in cell wall biosynthesis